MFMPCLLAVVFAILRLRAFGIEPLVDRGLVWGAPNACVIAVNGGTLVLLGLLLERQSHLGWFSCSSRPSWSRSACDRRGSGCNRGSTA
jgi:hypothetical protein